MIIKGKTVNNATITKKSNGVLFYTCNATFPLFSPAF